MLCIPSDQLPHLPGKLCLCWESSVVSAPRVCGSALSFSVPVWGCWSANEPGWGMFLCNGSCVAF